eukprot:TRINITY_DN6462_c0_g2_i1.p1 TRINITY_DN6462_c0_g2~~TRINITY_DN6462_c0_g2_i1.p1  ORF type:complete len:442 (+),score=110.68 TRINITY_DN6462_c0_g2_i1:89-1414(+)
MGNTTGAATSSNLSPLSQDKDKGNKREKSPSLSFAAEPDPGSALSREDSFNSSGRNAANGDDPIVLDTGSYTTRIGYASYKKCYDEHPTLIIADKMPPRIPTLSLRHDYKEESICPFQMQQVVHWDAMEEVWTHSFDRCTLINVSSRPTRSVLLTEPLLGGVEFRKKAGELMFEKLRVDSLAIETGAVMALASTSKSTGVVVDVGHDSTSIVVVNEGKVVSKRILEYGGKHSSQYLDHLLKTRNIGRKEDLQMSEIYAIKEERGFLVMNFEDEMKDPDLSKINFTCPSLATLDVVPENPTMEMECQNVFELSDGELKLEKERFQCAEIFFQPSLVGIAQDPLHQVIKEQIGLDNLELYRNITVTGGSSLFPGFTNRLQREVGRHAPIGAVVQFNLAHGHESRRLGSWYGAANYANTFPDEVKYVTKQQFEEFGINVFHRKA